MATETDFDGESLIVLPKDYMHSVEAACELHEDELAARTSSLEIDNLSSKPGFFHGTLLAAALWIVPSIWTVCQ
jgi:hypothetical protein